MRKLQILIISLLIAANAVAQTIEPCPCKVTFEEGLEGKCGYLVVPENRAKPNRRQIKIPFIYVRNPEIPEKNVTIYSTGGPGYSTIDNYTKINKSFAFLKFGSYIAFNQRGTKSSIPCLECPEVNEAIKKSYQYSLNKDSLVNAATTVCRKRLAKEGIDLSAYTTYESAADISDLIKTLQLDSVVLFGVSYSGGLMHSVANLYPNRIKGLLLGSPLPSFTNYEEHALFSHQHALDIIFEKVNADSSWKRQYPNLKSRFEGYFASITDRKFSFNYTPESETTAYSITYTKHELLSQLIDHITTNSWKKVPEMLENMMAGKHQPYVEDYLRNVWRGNQWIAHGERFSVYCSGQIAFMDKKLMAKQTDLMPWWQGFQFNSPTPAMCDCWQVNPEPKVQKQAVLTNIPALIVTGELDPYCPVYYNRLMMQTMPHAQSFVIKNQGHVPSLMVDGFELPKYFFENPHRKIIPSTPNIVVEGH
ncbi:MAG: alpha/beta fold hydrolase [Spirosomataceae bacterium]